jgi:MFS family permease
VTEPPFDPEGFEAERPGFAGWLRRVPVDISPLKLSRPFRRLWVGTGISAIGSQITAVAIPYQVYRDTGSTFVVGLLGIAALVPLLVVPLYGGAVADAVDRRKLLLLSDVALALVTVGLLANSLLADPSIPVLFGAELLGTAAYCFQSPTRNALTPSLVPPEKLTAALAIDDVVFTLARTAGPAVGGLLIALVGLSGAFALDLLTFGASFIVIWLLPSLPASPDVDRPSLRSVLDGLRYVRTRKEILAIFVVDANAMVFGMPSALFPAFAAELGGGAGVLGLLYAAPYTGALLASLSSGWVQHVRRQGVGVCIAASLWGVAIAAVGFTQALWLAFVFLAAAGAADYVSAILRNSILLAATPDHLRGRLSGIELAQVASAPQIGNVEAGAVAALTSLRFSIVSGGILTVIGTGVVAVAMPALVRYDAKRARE